MNINMVYPTIKPIFTELFNWIILNYFVVLVACIFIIVLSLISLKIVKNKKWKKFYENVSIFTIVFFIMISIIFIFNFVGLPLLK